MASLTPGPLLLYKFNTRHVLDKLDGIMQGLGNATREPLRRGVVKAGVIYFEDMRARFQKASAGDGTWQPLAASTVKRKGHKRIEVDSGRLYAAFTPGNSNNMIRVTPQGLQCALRGPIHAKYQHNGTKHIPPRALIAVPSRRAKLRMQIAINTEAARLASTVWRRPTGGGGGAGTNRSAA